MNISVLKVQIVGNCDYVYLLNASLNFSKEPPLFDDIIYASLL